MQTENKIIKIENSFYPIYFLVLSVVIFNIFFAFEEIAVALGIVSLIAILFSAFSKNYKILTIAIVVCMIVWNLSLLFFQIQFYAPYLVSDINLAVKVSAQTLLNGKNPYATTFYGTELDFGLERDGKFWEQYNKSYFAMEKFVYPPAIFMLSVPFYLIFGKISIQALYLTLIIINLFVIASFFKKKENLITALVLIFLTPPMIFNMNAQSTINVFAYTFLLAFLMFFFKKNKILSGISIGIFFAAKQFSFVTIPFLLIYFLKNGEKKTLIYSILTFMAIILPFIIWSPIDFFDDTITPIFCSGPNCYPEVNNWPNFGYITSHLGLNTQFSALLSSILLFAAPLAILLFYLKQNKPTMQETLFLSGLALIATVFFSKMGPLIYYDYGFFIILTSFIVYLRDRENGQLE